MTHKNRGLMSGLALALTLVAPPLVWAEPSFNVRRFLQRLISGRSHPVVEAPSPRHATAQRVLDYLRKLPARADKRLISGQFLGHTGKLRPEQLRAYQTQSGYAVGPQIGRIHERTGEWVGLIGGDYYGTGGERAEYAATNALFLDYWRQGGLVMLSLHAPNPRTGGNSWDTAITLREVLTPGHPAAQRWQQELDRISEGLEALQRAGVVVIIRPFHEMNGDWFWWSQGEPEEFKALWQQMHAYFTRTKSLRHLVWLYAPNANTGGYTARYPGSAYVDVVGLDYYGHDPATMDPRGYDELIALGKPFGFAEFGPRSPTNPGAPDYDYLTLLRAIKDHFPNTVFWQSWHTRWGMHTHRHIEALLQDPWVLNRDDLRQDLGDRS